MYAVNRPLEYFDMPQVRKVVRDAKKDDYTLTSLVLGVVNTDAFRKQGPEVISTTAPKAFSTAARRPKRVDHMSVRSNLIGASVMAQPSVPQYFSRMPHATGSYFSFQYL